MSGYGRANGSSSSLASFFYCQFSLYIGVSRNTEHVVIRFSLSLLTLVLQGLKRRSRERRKRKRYKRTTSFRGGTVRPALSGLLRLAVQRSSPLLNLSSLRLQSFPSFLISSILFLSATIPISGSNVACSLGLLSASFFEQGKEREVTHGPRRSGSQGVVVRSEGGKGGRGESFLEGVGEETYKQIGEERLVREGREERKRRDKDGERNKTRQKSTTHRTSPPQRSSPQTARLPNPQCSASRPGEKFRRAVSAIPGSL